MTTANAPVITVPALDGARPRILLVGEPYYRVIVDEMTSAAAASDRGENREPPRFAGGILV